MKRKRLKFYDIPLGQMLTIVGAAPVIWLLKKYVETSMPILLFGAIGTAVAAFLITVLLLRNTNTLKLLNDELEDWCLVKEPKLYRDYGDQVVDLLRTKKRYISWIRWNYKLPSRDDRLARFDEIYEVETSLSPEQKIKKGLEDRRG